MFLQAILFSITLAATGIQAQRSCPQLCNHNGISNTPSIGGYCSAPSTPLTLGKFESCCPSSTQNVRGCPAIGSGQVCRTIPASGRYCDPDTDPLECKTLAGSKLYMNLTVVRNPQEQCCASCQCFGDPNCVSFKEEEDEWVLCDARKRKGDRCKLDKNTCLSQKDHNGNTCQWLRKGLRRSWSVALNGSPCQPNFDIGEEPKMTMYSTSDFKFELVMGERGVIQRVMMTTTEGKFELDARDCDDYRGDTDLAKSWRLSQGALPDTVRQWVRVLVNDLDTRWFFSDEATGISVDLSCTKSFEKSKRLTGPPRINVNELLEPDAQFQNRRNPDGFCVTGVISEKNSSSSVTDTLHDFCSSHANEDMAAAQSLCGNDITLAEIPSCQAGWCAEANGFRGQVDDCLKAIDSKGWAQVYCEAAALYPTDNQDSNLSENRTVRMCLKTIREFSFAQAVDQFGLGKEMPGTVDQRNCAPNALVYLEEGLFSECDDRFDVMYQSGDGEWHVAFTIPAQLPPCQGQLAISYEDFPMLFTSPIQLRQCDRPQSCPTGKCTSLAGLREVNVRFSSMYSHAEYLVRQGLAHCKANPKFPNDKYWCLSKVPVFEEACPCLPCRPPQQDPVFGRRLLSGETM